MLCDRHYLSPLMEPGSVVLVGASPREGSVGAILSRNLLEAGYGGRIFFVNPRHHSIFGQSCYARLEDLPEEKPDLAVLCTPLRYMPELIESCGRRGIRFAIALTTTMTESVPKKAAIERRMLDCARRHGMRLLGPDSLGLLRPKSGLHLAYTHSTVFAGHIGLISQSGALCTAVLDWAQAHRVGFSSVISLGNTSDIDFGEALDYLANDPQTHSIFLYIESLRNGNARRFMSALRTASRSKPVLLIKVGRGPVAGLAARRHSGQTPGQDAVFDAAFRRAGVVRLDNVGQMFATAQSLNSRFQPRGKRLAILTNGGGLGVLAADQAECSDIPLAQLSPDTLQGLDKLLPAGWPRANPIDLGTDAHPARYVAALKLLQDDDQVDGLLALLAPHPASDPSQTARLMIEQARRSSKPLITCWMGETQVTEARRLFNGAAIPSLRTPESAVELFSHLSQYFHNQQLLLHTPPAVETLLDEPPLLLAKARTLLQDALAKGRNTLDDGQIRTLFSCFRINLHFPQPDEPRPHGHTLRVALLHAPPFGPAISLGGISDIRNTQLPPVVTLPPLNEALIDDLLRTSPRLSRKYLDAAPLKQLLLRISEMVCELPALHELEIDLRQPTPTDWIITRVRLSLTAVPPGAGPYDHMAIHPYPAQLVTSLQARNGQSLTLRPITPQDASLQQEFVQHLSPQSRYFRYMNSLRELSPAQLARTTQIDYDHEMALIATHIDAASSQTLQIGEVRYATNPDGHSCEFAIALLDKWQGQGLARQMMERLVEAAKQSPRLKTMHGDFLNDNERVQSLARKLGFTLEPHPQEPGLKRGTLPLR